MRCRRTIYAVVTIAVLAITPIAIFIITKLVPDNPNGSPEVWLSQATAPVGGLVATHRATAAWLDNKFAAANFVKAIASLKANIYAFEEDFREKAFDEDQKLTEECRAALHKGVREARDIVTDQRDEYFAASAPSSVNIANSLTKASQDTAAIFKAFQAPAFLRALADEKAAQVDLAEKENLRREIEVILQQNKLIDALIVSIEQELAAESEPNKIKMLEPRLAGLRKIRNTNETALTKKQATLAAI
jgi:hypothetical protein